MNENKQAAEFSEHDSFPENMCAEEASLYSRTKLTMVRLDRIYKLLKCGRLGKNYVCKKEEKEGITG